MCFMLQITLTLDTCPFPSSDAFVATIVSRNVTISSLPAASSSSSRQAGAAAAPPYWINCNYLTDRLELKSGYKITLSHLVLLNCRTWSLAGVLPSGNRTAWHGCHAPAGYSTPCSDVSDVADHRCMCGQQKAAHCISDGYTGVLHTGICDTKVQTAFQAAEHHSGQ